MSDPKPSRPGRPRVPQAQREPDPEPIAIEAGSPEALDALEQVLGERFESRVLLRRALTHRSWLNENDEQGAADNERLEFLGDALVDFVAGDFLFRRLPSAKEGELTVLRAQLVKEATLGRIGSRLGLGPHLRLGRGEIQSGGRDRPSILCDAIEALIGALYIDRGYDVAAAACLRWLEPEIQRVLARERAKDPKSRFQEQVQAALQVTPSYRTTGETGPDHDKRFEVEVWVADRIWASGEGRSKAAAARDAARRALEMWDRRTEVSDLPRDEGPAEAVVPAPQEGTSLGGDPSEG